MSEAIISYGATVERSANNTTWTEIPECKGIAIPTVTQEYADVTNLDSPNGFKEYIRGLRDAGEITLPCNYTEAGYTQQIADQASNSAIYYRVTLKTAPGQSTTGDRFAFRGFPTPRVVENGLGEAIGMEIAIRTTGDVTFTGGS